MRTLRPLLRVQLLGAFGVNRLLHAGTRAERRRALLFAVGFGILALILILYCVGIAIGLGMLGLASAVPPMMVLTCSLITLTLTFLKSNGTLFGFRDYDMVMSLPVRTSTVIASRLLTVYSMDFLFTVAAMLPAMIVYQAFEGASLSVWIMMILALPLIPLLPMTIAAIAGALITAIAVRFRRSNVLTVALSFAAIIGILVASFSLQETNIDELTALGTMLAAGINSIYPPAQLYAGILTGNWLSFFGFALLSLLPTALFVAVLSRFYGKINSALFSRRAMGNYRLGAQKTASPLRALHRREMRRLFSSTMYLLNTCIGSVLMVAASVAVVVMDISSIESALEMPGIAQYILPFAPLVPLFFIAMGSTTCVSLNMEGTTRWLALSLPVRTIDLFNAKILANLTILLPAALLSGALLAIGLGTDVVQTLLMFATPSALCCFIAVAGMAMNVKFPRYDWTSEQQAVKQSMAMGVTLGIGFGATVIFFCAAFLFMQYSALAILAATALFVLLALLIYRWLGKVRLSL